jgi:hypothetical protein
MARSAQSGLVMLVPAFAAILGMACTAVTGEEEASRIRAIEHQRLRALVGGDTTVAGPLHAADFQLINPRGEALSRTQYLGGIATGELDYQVWDPDSIEVHLTAGAAVIRYQSNLSIIVKGDTVPLGRYWHTDSYEKRRGTWQVVWSQATQIP